MQRTFYYNSPVPQLTVLASIVTPGWVVSWDSFLTYLRRGGEEADFAKSFSISQPMLRHSKVGVHSFQSKWRNFSFSCLDWAVL